MSEKNEKLSKKAQQINGSAQNGRAEDGGWKVKASEAATNTSNPIREVIETMNLAENPNKKVIPLSIGDPTIFGNLKPSKEILDAIQRSNSSGKYYGYQTAAGLEAARVAVAEYHFKCTGNRIKHQDVILASGCSHALDLCICVLARRNQNILIPRPGFPLYKTLTSVYGIQYKQYNLLADNNWSIDLKHLESLIDKDTAAIVINNPSNPCGSVFSEEHLKEILSLAERHRLPIISDEIYDKFVFSPAHYRESSNTTSNIENRQPIRACIMSNDADNNDDDNGDVKLIMRHDTNGTNHGHTSLTDQYCYVPFISLSELSDTVPILTCGGISKTCLIPGLRLGWIIINDKANNFDSSVRLGLGRLTQRLMGPNSLIQGALQDILTNVPEKFYTRTMDFIFKNARLCYERLKQIYGLSPYMPQGSMYLMVKFNPKVLPNIDGDRDFTSKLMNEESVLVLPGSCFDFPNFFRICLTVPTDVMEEALNRIEEFCARHAISQTTETISEVTIDRTTVDYPQPPPIKKFLIH